MGLQPWHAKDESWATRVPDVIQAGDDGVVVVVA